MQSGPVWEVYHLVADERDDGADAVPTWRLIRDSIVLDNFAERDAEFCAVPERALPSLVMNCAVPGVQAVASIRVRAPGLKVAALFAYVEKDVGDFASDDNRVYNSPGLETACKRTLVVHDGGIPFARITLCPVRKMKLL